MDHRFEFHVFFGDCDEAGIVFYPRYFVWFDNAFADWCRAREMSQRMMRTKLGIFATPIVEANATFHATATYDDRLVIEAGISEWRDRTFRVDYTVMRDATLVAKGYEVRISVTREESGRFCSCPIPALLKDALS